MGSYCALCGLHVPPGVQQCRMCGNTRLISPPAPDDSGPTFSFRPRELPNAPMPKWLWAVALGLVVTPIFRINSIVSTLIPALFGDQFQAYRDAHPGLVGLLVFQFVMNVLLVLAALALNLLFYGRSRRFPICMVVYASVTFCYLVVVAGVMNSLYPDMGHSMASFYSLVRSLLWVGLLIPYLLASPEIRVRFDR